MKKYISIALCAAYFVFVPLQASAFVCSPYQSDQDYLNCVFNCAQQWWVPTLMCI